MVIGAAVVVVPVGFGTLLRSFLLRVPHIPRPLVVEAVQPAEGAFNKQATQVRPHLL